MMMMKIQWCLTLLLLLGIAHNVNGTLYGVITDFYANGTQTVVLTVTVDPLTGKFTQVAENFVYVGSSATYDGIATYDQKNNYFYFSSDYEASFVYGLDIATKEILPPISINSDAVASIDWDGTNRQLLILGVFEDHSSAVVTFPYTGPSVQLLNFTAHGMNTPQATYLDWAKGIYYFIYYSATTTQYFLGSFPVSSPKNVQSAVLNCGKLFSPDYLFFDSTNNVLFGLGFNATAKAFKYFTIKATFCSVIDVGLTGIVTAATYNPTNHMLYLGYVDSLAGSSVVSLDITTQKVMYKSLTARTLEDLQVSYKV